MFFKIDFKLIFYYNLNVSIYRAKYIKTGAIRFISHLDIVRLFSRAIRRSELPVIYSSGFSPHLKISLSPPLPLGFTSLCELIDIYLSNDLEDGHIKDKINEQLPEMARVINLKKLDKNFKSLNLINCVEYKIEILNKGEDVKQLSELSNIKNISLKDNRIHFEILIDKRARPDKLLKEFFNNNLVFEKIERTKFYYEEGDVLEPFI